MSLSLGLPAMWNDDTGYSLYHTNSLTVLQELILVFARLILMKVEALLDFLTMTPGPDGSPALNFVLTQWCSRQHVFFGSYETKVA